MIQLYGVVDCVDTTCLGGGLRRFLRNAKHLSQNGFEVHLLTLLSNADHAFQETWGAHIHPIVLPDALPHTVKRARLLNTALQQARQSPVGQRLLLTGGTCLSWQTFRQLLTARIQRVPTLYDSSMFPDPLPARLLDRWRAWLQLHACLRAHNLIVCQTHAQQRCHRDQFRISTRKLWLHPNGVDCERFQPATPRQRALARARWQIPEKTPLVITVANVMPRKGIDFLVKAWHRMQKWHPEAQLIIAGTLGRRSTAAHHALDLDHYAHQVQSLIQSLPRPEHVHLIGSLEAVESLHHAADAFVFASEQEGLPNAVLEAMASGLPCLTTRYAGFPQNGEELGIEGQTFQTTERSPDVFADALANLLADAPRRQEIGDAARSWMLQTQDLRVLRKASLNRLHALATQGSGLHPCT